MPSNHFGLVTYSQMVGTMGLVKRLYPHRKPRLYIAEWREKRGLTQEQLANRLGTSDVTISRWETGKRWPGIPALQAIAEALGHPPLVWQDLTRHPDSVSIDAELRDQPPEVWDNALKMARAIRQ